MVGVIASGDPLERSDSVLGGTRVFRSTHVPVRALVDELEAGERPDGVVNNVSAV